MSLAVSFPSNDAHDLFFGHERSIKAFESSLDNNSLHHAWILAGPQGIGKTTLALKLARFLLDNSISSLDDAKFDGAAGRKMSAGAHPNFLKIERGTDTKGNLKTEITIDVVRQINSFFGTTPGEGGWRVVVVDCADELNRNAANALLKNLEEPPKNCIFFLISHKPASLLPTIRSRCRILSMQALNSELTLTAISALANLDDAQARQIAQLSPNSPGRALHMASQGGAELQDIMHQSLLGEADWKKIHGLASTFNGRDGGEKFKLFITMWSQLIANNAKSLVHNSMSASQVLPLLDFCDWLNASVRRNEALNLDRKQLLLDSYAKWQAMPIELRQSAPSN